MTFRSRLRRAGALVGERRLPEAEAEIVEALGLEPDDLGALKLLALVRFRLGRLAEARELYRPLRRSLPYYRDNPATLAGPDVCTSGQ